MIDLLTSTIGWNKCIVSAHQDVHISWFKKLCCSTSNQLNQQLCGLVCLMNIQLQV